MARVRQPRVKSLIELTTSESTTASVPWADQRLLLTGTTGFLGGHFAYWREQLGGALHNLIRGDDITAAAERLTARLEGCASSYHLPYREPGDDAERHVVLGDIEQPRCGVSDADVAALRARGIDQVWHFAANISFKQRLVEVIERQNIEGARNAVQLAAAVGARRFLYCSTAYTAGARTGAVPEQLHDPDGEFNNVYERSKCRAEHEVVRLCAELGLELRILRPGIVIGPSQSARPGGTSDGLYGFISQVDALKGALHALDHELVLPGEPDTPLHVIPVDYVVRDMLHLAENDFGDQQIYHLTSAGTASVDQTLARVCKRVGVQRIRIGQRPPGKRSAIETLLDRQTRDYGAYLRCAKQFERSLPGEVGVGPDDIDSYIGEFVRELRDQTSDAVFERSVEASFDGTIINVYRAGPTDGVPVVLVNAYGMPVDFWLPMARRLADRHRVITWETRGVPSIAKDFDPDTMAPATHVRDLLHLMDAEGIGRAHVLGWSTGTQVALRFAHDHGARVITLSLLNGSYCHGDDVAKSAFRTNLSQIMPKIATSLKYARIYHELIYGNRTSQSYLGAVQQDGDKLETVADILAATDPLLLNMTSLPFRTPEALYRYAHLFVRFQDGPRHAWTRGVTAPTLIWTGDQDLVSHPDESLAIAKLMPHARIENVPDTDHFALHGCEALFFAVEGHLRCGEAAP